MNNLVFLVPLFPLIGFLINGLGRKSLAKQAIGAIGSASILASFVVSIILFLQVKSSGAIIANYFNFIDVASLKIPGSKSVSITVNS